MQIQGDWGPGRPTPGFEAPKLSIFGPCLIFLYSFCLTLLSIIFLSYFTIFHNLNSKNLHPHFTQHLISQLMQIKSKSLSSWSSFNIFEGNRCTPKPQ